MKQYSLDITINNSTDSEVPEGVHVSAITFCMPKHMLAEHGATLVSWGQLTDFSLTVGSAKLNKQDIFNALDGFDLNNGAGPGGTRPTCIAGIVFESRKAIGFFGELFVPIASESPFYNVSLGRSEAIVNNNINIGTNPEGRRGVIVASGLAEFQ